MPGRPARAATHSDHILAAGRAGITRAPAYKEFLQECLRRGSYPARRKPETQNRCVHVYSCTRFYIVGKNRQVSHKEGSTGRRKPETPGKRVQMYLWRIFREECGRPPPNYGATGGEEGRNSPPAHFCFDLALRTDQNAPCPCRCFTLFRSILFLCYLT
jgi:hypothetical protein